MVRPFKEGSATRTLSGITGHDNSAAVSHIAHTNYSYFTSDCDFWMLGVCCVKSGMQCTDQDSDDFCEDFNGNDAWKTDDHICCILAPCNKGNLCTLTVLLAWSIICPCPPGFATVVCLGMYCLYNCIRHKECVHFL